MICSSLSESAKDGIGPIPFVTRSTTSSASGCASSRFGPIVPLAPAASSVWQLPHPLAAKISAPAVASPAAPVGGSARRLGRDSRLRGLDGGFFLDRVLLPLGLTREIEDGQLIATNSSTVTQMKPRSRSPGKSGFRRGKTNEARSAKPMKTSAMTPRPILPFVVIPTSTGRKLPRSKTGGRLLAFERGHREAVVHELRPVELGLLLMPRPDGRTAGRVDPVRDAIPRSKSIPGSTAASAKATPSKVLWSSFSTITRQGASRPESEPSVGRVRVGVWVTVLIAGKLATRSVGSAVMTADERLEKYARLAVEVGSNVGEGQVLWVNALVEHAPLVRAIARVAYERGARFVDVEYTDQHARHARIANAPEDTLDWSTPWSLARMDYLAEHHGAIIQISGDPEPELFADLDGARVGKTRAKELSERYFAALNERTLNWTIVAFPNEGWARTVFGEPDVERLWDAVATATRLDEADPVAAWREHSTPSASALPSSTSAASMRCASGATAPT